MSSCGNKNSSGSLLAQPGNILDMKTLNDELQLFSKYIHNISQLLITNRLIWIYILLQISFAWYILISDGLINQEHRANQLQNNRTKKRNNQMRVERGKWRSSGKEVGMVCRAGWGEEDTMWSELFWWVEELGRGRNSAVTGSTLGGGGRRRLAWRAGDACAMNQLSKYGPCFSLQYIHPVLVRSGWTSLLPVYLLLSLPYYSTLLTVMEEALPTTQYVFLSACSLYYRW